MSAWDWLLSPFEASNSMNGQAVSGLKSLTNTLEGDPNGYANAMNSLQDKANKQAEYVKNFLLGREQQAQQTYRPMQRLFQGMYGTGGLMPAKAPGAPGGGSAF